MSTKPIMLATGGPITPNDFLAQVLELRRERDVARSERDLMERMYHGGLGTMENYMKLNAALREFQQMAIPAVRAVREILQARPELKDVQGVVRACVSTRPPASAVPPGESLCVGEVVQGPDGSAFLRCANCNVMVVKLSSRELAVMDSPSVDSLRQHWASDWAAHTSASARPPVAKPDRMTGVAEVLAHGHETENPNAGVKQAFPKGRWT